MVIAQGCFRKKSKKCLALRAELVTTERNRKLWEKYAKL